MSRFTPLTPHVPSVARTISRYLLITVPLVILSVAVCMQWVDRPVALWVSHLIPSPNKDAGYHLAVLLTQLVYCGMIGLFVLYFVLRMAGLKGRVMECFWLFNQSIAFTYFIKTTLQFLFGRYIPRYPEMTTLLFVHNPKLYGFHWLMVGCFPSGHIAVLSTGLTAVCLYYRRWLIPSVILWALLTWLLVALNYHFVSDIIAGTYIGISVTLALDYLRKVP